MPHIIPQVFTGQQDLCGGVVVSAEKLVVNVHQLTLANGGCGLFGRHIGRPLAQIKLPHTHPDGTGGDQNNLVPGIFNVAEHFAKRFHMADVHPAAGVRQGRCPNFHNNSHLLSLPAADGTIIAVPAGNCKRKMYSGTTCKMYNVKCTPEKSVDR